MGKTIDKVIKGAVAQVPEGWEVLKRPQGYPTARAFKLARKPPVHLAFIVDGRYIGRGRGPKFRILAKGYDRHWFTTAAVAIAYWELAGERG